MKTKQEFRKLGFISGGVAFATLWLGTYLIICLHGTWAFVPAVITGLGLFVGGIICSIVALLGWLDAKS